MLLGVLLVVKDGVGEPAIAFHAAHDLDLLEDEIEVGIELDRETRRRRLAAAVDHRLHRRIDVLLDEILVTPLAAALALTARKSCAFLMFASTFLRKVAFEFSDEKQ